MTDGAEFHEEDVGASSIVWHADRPSTRGRSNIRSWGIRSTNANAPREHAITRR
jgi:hypothetical protein